MTAARGANDFFRHQLRARIAAKGVARRFFGGGHDRVPVNGRRRKENKMWRAPDGGAGIQDVLQQGQVDRLLRAWPFLGSQWQRAPTKVKNGVEIRKHRGLGKMRNLLKIVSGRSREGHHFRITFSQMRQDKGSKTSTPSCHGYAQRIHSYAITGSGNGVGTIFLRNFRGLQL